MLIDELVNINDDARRYFTSKEFRATLDGESAEAFKDKSIAIEKYYSGNALKPNETYTVRNISNLKKLLKEKLVLESGWTLLISYLTVKMPNVGDIEVQAIPNYDDIAKIIINERDSFLIKLYMNFILATQASDDEMRSYGLARLYDSLPRKFLDILSTYEPRGREIIMKSLAWGMLNIKYPIGKNKSEKNLQDIFPNDKSIYDKNYKHKFLVTKVSKAVLDVLK